MVNIERDIEYLPESEASQFKVARIRELMAGEWQKAPGFVRRLAEAGVTAEDLKTADDITRFPILRKSEMTSIQSADPPFGSLITVPPGQLRRIYSSPGPIYVPDGRLQSYYRWERAFAACGFTQGDIVLNCFNYHLTPAGAMFEEAAGNLGCAVIPAGIGNSEIQVKEAAHFKANAYVGLPSYLTVVLEKAAEVGVTLVLEKAFVIAEKLPESLRKQLQDKHGIRVRQAYGTAEVGAIAYECEEGNGMHVDPSVLLEILDPETGHPVEPGETGEVVVSVINPINTLLRFATGDLSSATRDECPCGRKSPRLTGILGRVDQVIKVRGLFVHPAQLTQTLSEFEEVERFRAVITRERAMDDITIEVEGKTRLSGETLKDIGNRIKQTLKLTSGVAQVKPGTIPEDAGAIDDRRKWD
ncbi:MAG: AMP-binding protein [bacterium]|nr:AMP-binding protein [bacterium]MDT8395805.1 AMP-binding protein [bacterium]